MRNQDNRNHQNRFLTYNSSTQSRDTYYEQYGQCDETHGKKTNKF